MAIPYSTQIASALRSIKPFDCLDERLLLEIAGDTTLKAYTEESTVFLQGEQPQPVIFFILEGRAAIVTGSGKKQTAAGYRNPGEFFGETALLPEESYPVSIIAASVLKCLLVPLESLKSALRTGGEFASLFAGALSGRLLEFYRALYYTTETESLYGQPLRKRISDIAVTNVTTCLPLEKVSDLAGTMSRANVSSVVVVGPNQRPLGIVTEKDLVTKVLSRKITEQELSAYQVMSSGLITVKPEDFVYQALYLMVKHQIKHLVVTDEHRRLCGIVTVQDLVRARNTGALSIVDRIEYQHSTTGVAAIMEEVDQVQQALLLERAYASEICSLVSELYDRVTRKIIYLSEQEMSEEGWGQPPARYCFVNMGSAGRKEQYARTDQDNGIIYADPFPEKREKIAAYFLALGEKIVSGLESCGFKRCKGGVMANHERWCRPLSVWRENVTGWIEKLDPADIRKMTIFLDFRFLAGENDLYVSLKDFVTRRFQRAAHALLFMAEDDLRHRVPLNMFKQIVTERSGTYRQMINLKSAASVHLLDCVRIFALREGIRETNTFERIRRLRERGIFKAPEADSMEAAYETLMMLRIKDSLQKMKQGLEPDNYINPKVLSKKEQSALTESFIVINNLQTLTAHAFRVRNH